MKSEPCPPSSCRAAAVPEGRRPRRAADLERVGLHTVEDLLFRFPLRYEDRARPRAHRVAAARAPPRRSCGEVVSSRPRDDAAARLQDLRADRARRERPRARRVSESAVSARRFHPGSTSCSSGASRSAAPAACSSPTRSTRSSAARRRGRRTVHTGRIVPVYEKAGRVTPKMQRRARARRAAAAAGRPARSAAGGRARARAACPIARAALARRRTFRRPDADARRAERASRRRRSGG